MTGVRLKDTVTGEEIMYFPKEEIEMDVSFDDIVASEIEDLKIEYEYDERSLQLYDEIIFKEELFDRVVKSFKSAYTNYIEGLIDDIYNELPDFIFDELKWINVESYINEEDIKKLAKKYIYLVYDTPEQDYTYYKKYIYDGHLLINSKDKENLRIHNIYLIKDIKN